MRVADGGVAVMARGKELRVEVPDDRRGSSLAQRLASSELTRTGPETWEVIGSANGDLSSALATIQQWLRDEEIKETVVCLSGRRHTMTRD
jgi:hypothetical protein